ncbi:MAG: amidohydrolase [Chitinophagales bacterium]|nr:amidohydrolase [Chitinophagales bacterium]
MIDKIFCNGNIFTQDKENPFANAFAIAHGKIVAVGGNEEVLALRTPNTKLETLNNKTVLPGFNDAHIHIWKVGNLLTYMLDLRGVRSIDEMQQRIFDYAQKNPQLEWIQARGFNEALFPDERMPTKFDLDKVISDRPVAVIRTCAHQLIVNSKALELAGINSQSQTPAGGEIKKFESGELKGHFTETALGLVMNKIQAYNADQYKVMINAAQKEFLKLGITSATDPAVMPDLLEVYYSMEKNDELKVRVNAIPIRLPDGATKALPLPKLFNSDFLNVNTVKFFADGGLSGKTAALKRPYKNSNDYGVLRLEENLFFQLALEAQQAGFKIATHAIGDAALNLVLKVYEGINASATPSSLRRAGVVPHRLEHVGLPSQKNLEDMKRMNVSAVMQPIFLYELGKNFIESLDDAYLSYVYPCKTILNYGINLSLSTDAPVVKDFNPMLCIQSAVERKDIAGNVIAATEKISVEEALFAYTMGSAIANGDENNRGSIETGKFADFIVLDKNPFETISSALSIIKVQSTFIGGKKVY